MVETVNIPSNKGITSRQLDQFITKARLYENTEVFVSKDERRANAKSMLGLMSLTMSGGDIIKIIAYGPEENIAVEELKNFIESGFDEVDS